MGCELTGSHEFTHWGRRRNRQPGPCATLEMRKHTRPGRHAQPPVPLCFVLRLTHPEDPGSPAQLPDPPDGQKTPVFAGADPAKSKQQEQQ